MFISARRELRHRRVKHYGYEFRYDNNNVDKDKPLPGGQISHSTHLNHYSVLLYR